MIPIQIQGNYHFMPREDFNLYAGLGLGRNIISFEGEDSSPSDGEFTITPRIGVNFMFNDAFGLDFNTGYTIAGDFYSYIPLNLGVIYFVD
jgi:outer membrane protein W